MILILIYYSNLKGVTAISTAAHKGHVDIMQKLIDAGAVVNAVNRFVFINLFIFYFYIFTTFNIQHSI